LLKGVSDRKTQQTQFDHRLRLEKEYEIYGKLWDTLFEMRRSIATLVVPTSSPAPIQEVSDAFNVCQAVVRRNEPFITASVFEPARKILKLGRMIESNLRNNETIRNMREGMDFEADQKYADKQIQLDKESTAALDEIGKLMEVVSAAIRARITLGD
jgi:hypothetical protein